MAKKDTFTQVAFKKRYQGVDEIGVIVRQRFYPLVSTNEGDTIVLRDGQRGLERCFGTFWSLLTHSRAI